MARAHSATSHVRPSRLGSSVRKTPGKPLFVYAQYDKKNSHPSTRFDRLNGTGQWNSSMELLRIKIVILREPQDKNCQRVKLSSFDRLRIRIVNANTELIPEAPNRQPIFLIVVASVSTANGEAQVAVPSIVSIALCRTPPVTVVANAEVSIVVAGTARKTSK